MSTIDVDAIERFTEHLDDEGLADAVVLVRSGGALRLTSRTALAEGMASLPQKPLVRKLMHAHITKRPPPGHVGVLVMDSPPITNVRVRKAS